MLNFFRSMGPAALALFVACMAPAAAQHTARDIRDAYTATSSPDCASSSRPAFLCDGVLIRVTTHSDQYYAWEPTPADQQSGGISFSYMRADANFSRLAGNGLNGFILYPLYSAPSWAMAVQVLCAFPLAGQTQNRTANGCGARTDDTSGATGPCHVNGITTAQQWVARYQPKDGTGGYHACGFDVAYQATVPGGTANAFNQVIAAMNLLNTPNASSDISFHEQNELRARAWDKQEGYKLPLEAFFYIEAGGKSGLKDAQADQKDFNTVYARFVPIIKVGLPTALGQQATFNYESGDQVVAPPSDPNPTPCTQYIQSGVWTQPSWSTHKSLTLTPTQCTRAAPWVLVDAAFAEVEKKYSGDPEWKNSMGMRNQFACHFQKAKAKAVWDLEPDRKVESYADTTNRDDCNPPFQ